ncbi:MAG: hypothetical protein WBD31_14080 [Rubripirellula sp.]
MDVTHSYQGTDYMMTETRIIRIAFATWFCFSFGNRVGAESPNTKSILFQGQSWTGHSLVRLETTFHDGHESLRVQTRGVDSIATVDGIQFHTGTIEMDVSASHRSQPTLALFVDESGKNFDRITFNPLPVYADEPPRRLRQGIVTTGKHQSVVVDFHHGTRAEWERQRWSIELIQATGRDKRYLFIAEHL